jgi:exosome complex exonuclease RRP6
MSSAEEVTKTAQTADPTETQKFCTDAKEAMVALISAVNGLPPDLDFYMAASPSVGQQIRSLRKELLQTTNSFLFFVSPGEDPFEDFEDFADRRETVIIDAADQLLEKADTCMDEVRGMPRRVGAPVVASSSTSSGPKEPSPTNKKAQRDMLDQRLRYASHIRKPQLKFEETIDNSNSRFVPKIRVKPNAKVPLTDYSKGIPIFRPFVW